MDIYAKKRNEGRFGKKLISIIKVNLFSFEATLPSQMDFSERIKCHGKLAHIVETVFYCDILRVTLIVCSRTSFSRLFFFLDLLFIPVSHSLKDFVFVIIVFPRI